MRSEEETVSPIEGKRGLGLEGGERGEKRAAVVFLQGENRRDAAAALGLLK